MSSVGVMFIVDGKREPYIFEASKPAAQLKTPTVVPPANFTFDRWVAMLIEWVPAARIIAAMPRKSARIFAAVLSTARCCGTPC
jgi:hypothetical protein